MTFSSESGHRADEERTQTVFGIGISRCVTKYDGKIAILMHKLCLMHEKDYAQLYRVNVNQEKMHSGLLK